MNQVELVEFFQKKSAECKKKAESVLKHYWEQIFLLAIYCQKQHADQDLQNRFKLINSLNLSKDTPNELRRAKLAILAMIEQGKSSHECYYYLKTHEDEPRYQALLRDMDSYGIHFASSNISQYPYRIWTMYKVNCQFLVLNEELISLYNAIQSPETLLRFFSNQLNIDIKKNQDVIGYCIQQKPKAMAELKDTFEAQLFHYYEYFMKRFFAFLNEILDPYIHETPLKLTHGNSSEQRTGIQILGVRNEEAWMTISVKHDYVQSMINIGQVDTLMASIKDVLIHKKFHRRHPTNAQSTEMAAYNIKTMAKRWERTKTGLLTRFDQVAKRLAAIFLFDINQPTSYFAELLELGETNILSREKQYEIVRRIFEMLPPSSLIDQWKSPEEPKMSERFKHLKINFKNGTMDQFKTIENLIGEQMSKGEIDPKLFDLNEGFPQPLWFTGFRHIEFDELVSEPSTKTEE